MTWKGTEFCPPQIEGLAFIAVEISHLSLDSIMLLSLLLSPNVMGLITMF